MVSLTSSVLAEKKQRPLQPRGKINLSHDNAQNKLYEQTYLFSDPFLFLVDRGALPPVPSEKGVQLSYPDKSIKKKHLP